VDLPKGRGKETKMTQAYIVTMENGTPCKGGCGTVRLALPDAKNPYTCHECQIAQLSNTLAMATEFYIGQCELPERNGTCSIHVKMDGSGDENVWRIHRHNEILTCDPDLLNPLPSDYRWKLYPFDNEIIETSRDVALRIAKDVLEWANAQE